MGDEKKKEYMTFRKNLFVMVTAIVIVASAAYLVGLSWQMSVYGMTFVLATSVIILMLEDLWRKFIWFREELTWQYFIGMLLVILSVVAFLWAAESVTTVEMVVRLGATAFLGCVGGFWFHSPYRKSLQDFEELETERWHKAQKKVQKAKNREEAQKIINRVLRYRLTDNSIEGELDFSKPIGEYRESCMTYEELLAIGDDNPQIQAVRARAGDYMNVLLSGMNFTEAENASVVVGG